MSYKLKHKKQKEIPESYYNDLEIQELRKRYKGHVPPISEVMRVGTRRTLHVEKLVHRKGHTVQYKDGLAIVKKVEKKGLYIQTFKKDKDGFSTPSGKSIFIPQHRVEHEIYPVTFPQLSIGVVSPYNMATVDE